MLYNEFYSKDIGYKIWLGVENFTYKCSIEKNATGRNYFTRSRLRGLYCMAKLFIDIETIQKIAGQQIFLEAHTMKKVLICTIIKRAIEGN